MKRSVFIALSLLLLSSAAMAQESFFNRFVFKSEIAFTEHTLPLGHKTNQGGIVRLGSVWDIDRYFGGFTGTMQMQWMSLSPIYTSDFYVHTRLFFGFRF